MKFLKYILPTLQSTSTTTDFEKLSDQQIDDIVKKLKNVKPQ